MDAQRAVQRHPVDRRAHGVLANPEMQVLALEKLKGRRVVHIILRPFDRAAVLEIGLR